LELRNKSVVVGESSADEKIESRLEEGCSTKKNTRENTLEEEEEEEEEEERVVSFGRRANNY
jgi:hypothetical protein